MTDRAPRPEGMSEETVMGDEFVTDEMLTSQHERLSASLDSVSEGIDRLLAERDAALAECRRLRADGATLRERVKKLPSPIEHRGELVDDVPTGRTFYVCDWCDARWKATKQHPVNGCLYVDGREGAPTPTLPPITNDVLTDVQLAWWLSHATDPWQVAIGRELTEARRTLALLAEDTRRLLLKTVDDFKASAPKEPTP